MPQAFGVTADDLFTGTAGFPPVPLTGAPIRAQGEHGVSQAASGLDLTEVESLRRDLDEVICEQSMTSASVDGWEATVMRHGRATWERTAVAMLTRKQDLGIGCIGSANEPGGS
jgi:hypothetical protein